MTGIFTKYKMIPKPDKAPLPKNWKPKVNEPIDLPHLFKRLEWRAVRGGYHLASECTICGSRTNL